MVNEKKKVLLVDGNSLMHRAFHAFPPLTTPDGRPVGAVFGFCKMLFSSIKKISPDQVIFAWDTKGGTFRNEIFPEYKKTREKTDEDLVSQFPIIQEFVDTLGLSQYSFDEFEADDVIGTLSTFFSKDVEESKQTFILTSDRDLLQLVNHSVFVILMKKGVSDVVIYGQNEVQNEYQIDVKQFIDLKALMGDSSDNIPGAKGVGIKTATKILQEYESVERLYLSELDRGITPRIKQILLEEKEQVLMSRRLAEIKVDVPVNFREIKNSFLEGAKIRDGIDYFSLLGFKSLQNDLRDLVPGNVGRRLPGSSDRFFLGYEGDVNTDIKSACSHLEQLGNGEVVIASLADEILYIFSDKEVFSFHCEKFFENTVLKGNFEKCTIVTFDVKDFMHKMSLYDVEIINWFDLKTAASLLLHGKSVNTLNDADGLAGLTFGFDHDASSDGLVCAYSLLYQHIKELFMSTEQGISRFYYSVENPLVKVLYVAEKQGVFINESALYQAEEILNQKISAVTEKVFSFTNVKFNLNSPKQLAGILFDELGLPSIKKTKTGRSTDEATLRKLESLHPIISSILEYRKLHKLLSTYIEGFKTEIAHDTRIHCNYKQSDVITGRLSSEKPNMQNIPRDDESEVSIRSLIAAPEGRLLLAFDYAQVELRILAHLSGDEELVKSFRKNLDIHAVTASAIYEVSVEDVTKEMRNTAKTVNFAIMYGIGPHALSESLSVSYKEAHHFIEMYFNTYKKVGSWQQSSFDFAKKWGYIETLGGRKVNVTTASSHNYRDKAFGKRAASNYPNQGSQADIIKKAMVSIAKVLDTSKKNADLILQIHDELVFEVDTSDLESLVPIVKNEMERSYILDVPLVVNVKVGKDFSNMVAYES